MSTINSKNVQVGTSGVAAQNFTLYQPNTPDGTVRLGVGNSGATTGDVVTVTNAGNVTVSGVATATTFSGSGASLTALNASNLSTGTVPDARFPATLPAASGVNLTALNASNLGSGTVPTARLATGTANNTTYLRGDQTWATVSGFSGPRANVYTSNSTFTIPSGITAVKVTVIGGGGGGSGSGVAGSASGNGGGTAIKWLTGLTPGNTLSVTIGAGGGGGGGSSHGSAGGASTVASGTQSITTITGGGGSASSSNLGGTATNGDLNIPGASGGSGNNGVVSGGSLYGNGVRATTSSNTATGYGAGGGKGNDSDCNQRGGSSGTAGVVVFEY